MKKEILLFIVSTFIGLMGCEALCRIFKLAPEIYHVSVGHENSPLKLHPNPTIGYIYKKNFLNQTNSFGFRDVPREIEKKKGMKRVIMLGDSVLDGNFSESLFHKKHGLSELRDIIPLQAQRLLKDVEVMNFGINGFCTVSQAELYKEYGIQFSPDLVIINFVENDYSECLGMILSVDSEKAVVREFLFENSYLFRFLALKFNWKGFRKNIDYSTLDKTQFPRLTEFMETNNPNNWVKTREALNERLNEYFNVENLDYWEEGAKKLKGDAESVQAALSLVQRETTKAGSDLVITIWPRFGNKRFIDVDPGEREVSRSHSMLIEQIARKLGIKTIRLSSLFAQKLKGKEMNYRKDLTVGDGMHVNERGARIAGEIFAEIIQQRLQ
jgi:hypothetical protein